MKREEVREAIIGISEDDSMARIIESDKLFYLPKAIADIVEFLIASMKVLIKA